jgi:tetratricopeptide (TPR) repeat protein
MRARARIALLGLALQLGACNGRPEAKDPALQAAETLLSQGKPAEAAALLEKHLSQRSEPSGEAQRPLAVALALAGDTRGAAEHYQRAVALRTDDIEAQVGLGRVLAMNGELERAGELLWAAVEKDPKNLPALLVAAALTDDAQRLSGLRARFEAIASAEGAPQIAELYLGLADASERSGKREAAARAVERAKSLPLGNPNVVLSAAELHRRKQRFGPAAHLFALVVRAIPGHVPAATRLTFKNRK